MADARRTYIAKFLIGAQLQGTFRGTMIAAQQRLRSLEATAKRVGSVFKWLGLGLGTLTGLFASFATAGVIRKLFGGAADQAIEANQRTKQLNASMMQFTAIAKRGPEFARREVEILRERNKQLAKAQIYQDEILDSATAQMAVMGIPPKEIARTIGPMMNVLAVSKGVKATMEDSKALATAWGSAIRTGMVRPLKQYGIVLTDNQRKEFRDLQDVRLRHEYLKRLITSQKYLGQAAKLMDTPEGKIFLFNQHLKDMQERLGKHILPLQAKIAAQWDKALPRLEPAIIRVLDRLGDAIDWVIHQSEEFNKVWNTEAAKTARMALSQSFREMGNALLDLAKAFGFDQGDAKSFGELIGKLAVSEIGKLAHDLHDLAEAIRNVADAYEHFAGAGAKVEEHKELTTTAEKIGGGLHILRRLGALSQAKYKATHGMTVAPGMATGGIVTKPTIAGIGEKGPEAVIPLSKLGSGAREQQAAARELSKAAVMLQAAAMQLTRAVSFGAGGGGVGYGIGGGGMLGGIVGGVRRMFGGGGGGRVSVGPITTDAGEEIARPGGYTPPAALTATDATLASQRARLIDELKIPEVAQRLYSNITTEVGAGHAGRTQAYIESVFNRALARGRSLMATISDRHYYPSVSLRNVRVGAKSRAVYDAILGNVAAGSNLSNFATGNESGSVRSGGAHITYAARGERFVHELADLRWIRQQQARGRLARAYAEGGIATTPQVATLAEKGPEMVLPLARPTALPAPIASLAGGRRGVSEMAITSIIAKIAMHEGIKEALKDITGGALGGLGGMAFLKVMEPVRLGAATLTPKQQVEAFESTIASLSTKTDPTSKALLERFKTDPDYLKAKARVGGAGGMGHTLNFTPNITINGPADEAQQRAMDSKLRDLATDFIKQFKAAQYQERRLSYGSGYG